MVRKMEMVQHSLVLCFIRFLCFSFWLVLISPSSFERGFWWSSLLVVPLLWCHLQGLIVLISMFSCCQCNGEMSLHVYWRYWYMGWKGISSFLRLAVRMYRDSWKKLIGCSLEERVIHVIRVEPPIGSWYL
ncbi:hypothetical protein RchiOBHm_Chr6g0282921 [Rosa chinensis]|uniref:Transmembrane protein n=1 Tax=Rosa chinensis TaxID=74649 RepID=A0A2P6PTW0_ROSCH|nr:hypothetical protein RchiOBHm_Chr6g0282921 [Rosa chinensis]